MQRKYTYTDAKGRVATLIVLEDLGAVVTVRKWTRKVEDKWHSCMNDGHEYLRRLGYHRA